MSASEGSAWRRDFSRDARKLGITAAVKMAFEAWQGDRRARTTRQGAVIGGGVARAATGGVRFAAGDWMGGGAQVVSGGLQVVGAGNAVHKDRATLDAAVLIADGLVASARADWPRELDKVLLGVQRQRQDLLHDRPGPAATETPVGRGRQITWALHAAGLPPGSAAEGYRHVCAELRRLHAEAPPRTPSVQPERAQSTRSTLSVVRAALSHRTAPAAAPSPSGASEAADARRQPPARAASVVHRPRGAFER
ncbi:hypothetical protein CLV92_106174 [Kineococcus xinjiangensis]|uniref:Uncharacterized protein n=1 Tax=Kineococcus xinjiangensis TaxID=512762 RepID=A0A2S6IM89_9ACTN|nr:hypothetical protein [Kineococcus xinjiangensis]PPK95353.1 hypothetical protein CLV92_106174 [Kineococcus xinjiangensis]